MEQDAATRPHSRPEGQRDVRLAAAEATPRSTVLAARMGRLGLGADVTVPHGGETSEVSAVRVHDLADEAPDDWDGFGAFRRRMEATRQQSYAKQAEAMALALKRRLAEIEEEDEVERGDMAPPAMADNPRELTDA